MKRSGTKFNAKRNSIATESDRPTEEESLTRKQRLIQERKQIYKTLRNKASLLYKNAYLHEFNCNLREYMHVFYYYGYCPFDNALPDIGKAKFYK
ncbi:hypothetical protein A0H76_328 [Hepatospora eriocheir]|uniref:Uncharacterized protein n=1 Tax=Hepatospora eriocheir TaxID=1081669 RepID=A0A1X0QA49_9MICR|nr:hypothetical protein HERIO_1437 [Hepatospora eriocheir]ORD99715.1 hypothetical protein A0H76_328 [Hepatospora eriocheir]